MNQKISLLSRLLLFVSSALLVVSIFVPIWLIDLDAPQYPEGLTLKIWANKLGGDVDIINGLNHYIGMKTLHAENFIEFQILTYIILFYAAFALVAAIVGRKKVLYTLFTMFLLFGIVAMIDFYRWEYDYGHDLDPRAAIIVPGMAYQPPLIGFKQLLNFGAYSIPDIGGWCFILSGVLMLASVIIETRFLNRFRKNKTHAAIGLVFVLIFFSSCSTTVADSINYNKDECDYCKMTISDQRFAAVFLTEKGRTYKFDDVSCLMGYSNENPDKIKNASFFVAEYLSPNALLPFENLTFIESEELGSPMGGNKAGFANTDSSAFYLTKYNGKMVALTAPK